MQAISLLLGLVGLVVMILFAILEYLGTYAILYIIGTVIVAGGGCRFNLAQVATSPKGPRFALQSKATPVFRRKGPINTLNPGRAGSVRA